MILTLMYLLEPYIDLLTIDKFIRKTLYNEVLFVNIV